MDFGQLRVTYVGDERPVVRAAGEVDRINRQTARNAEANDRLVERSRRQLANVQVREAKRGADAFIRELERTRRAERASGGGGGGVGSELSTLSGGRLAFAGGGAAAGIGAITVAFGAAAKIGVEYKETLDRLNKSFESLLGSQSAATAHLKELQEFAARTPFEFEDVARASQRFQNMGLAAKDVVPTLTAVGNAVAAAGGGSEQIDRVSLAISQMAAKGKVSAEEMNQLAEAGVGGWRILEQQLGKSKAELMKMAEQGQISADTFIQAFRRAHESGNAMQRQMETLSGATSTLKDKGREILADVFTPMHGLLRDISVELAKVTTEGWNWERALRAMASATRNFSDLSNRGLLDTFLQFQAGQLGGPAGILGMQNILGMNKPKPGGAQTWGEAPINIPEEFKYKPKISDSDLLGKMKQADEAARQESERKSEEAMRKTRAEAERQAGAVANLRERLRDLTIQNEAFSASEVEQEIALMRARVAAEDLSGVYRSQAGAVADLLAVQMRTLDVKKLIKEAEDKEKGDAKKRAEFQERLTSYVQAQSDAQRQVNDLIKDGAVLGALSAQEAQMLDVLTRVRQLKDTISFDSLLQPGKITDPKVELKPLDFSNVQVDHWKTYRESWKESLQYMRQDGVDIFADMFARIGEGWRSAAGGLVLDFARALNQMAAQAAANVVWGALLRAGTSLLGGALGGILGPNIPTASAAGGPGGINWLTGHAAGTPSAPAGLAWVGEQGPELVNFRGGERVFNNADSRRMAGTVINKTTIINYQPRVTPDSYSSRRSSREIFESLLGFAR